MYCVYRHALWPAGAEHIKQKKKRRRTNNKKASLHVTVKDPNNVEAKLTALGAAGQLQGSMPDESSMAPARAAAEPAAESAAEPVAELASEPAESAAESAAELAAVPHSPSACLSKVQPPGSATVVGSSVSSTQL